MKLVVQTTSQTDSVWSLYVEREKIGKRGPIQGWGPLCEVSLTLFIAELERWALDFLLLISLVSSSGFELCDLQVRDLAKSIIFSGLNFEFGHPRVLYEPVRVSMS